MSVVPSQTTDFMADLPLDQNGNPVFPPIEQLQSLIEEGITEAEIIAFDKQSEQPIFDDGDGSETSGQQPRIFIL